MTKTRENAMKTAIETRHEAYLAAHAKAVALLSALAAKINDMPAPDSGEQIHWGHIGSLNHVAELLSQAYEHLS